MAPAPKTERFMIRMDPDERRMLTELADQSGTSEATVVRQLVRRAHAERSTERNAKRSKPKR
jgi:hypothetical protein